MNICSDLVLFVDGELEPERADAFRAHLHTCVHCRAELVSDMQVTAHLATLARQSDGTEPAPGSPGSAEPARSPGSLAIVDADEMRRPSAQPQGRDAKWNRRWVAYIAPLVATAAALVLYVHAGSPVATTEPSPFAALKTRPYEIRLALAGATDYRRPHEELRSGDTSGAESVPYATLDALQRRRDLHALAIANAINGVKLSEVAAQLRGLPETPSVRSDRVAIEILRKSSDPSGRSDSVEPLLAELDSLARGSDVVARAARWNHAILLARMGLPLGAAQEFRAIADSGELGWSEEARQRASEQASRADFQRGWRGADKAGQVLQQTGAAVPAELVQRFPGVLRAYFYRALCSAPSRERVQALVPIAAQLDRRGDHPVLSELVQRATAADFRRRRPLAEAFARVLVGAEVAPGMRAQLLDERPPADVVDIALCSMFELDAIASHLDAFRALVKQAGDPWFEIILAQQEATIASGRGDWVGAEARLRQAQKLCNPAVQYRCAKVALQLAQLYQDQHRVPDAIAVAEDALRTARSAGEWGQIQSLLLRLSDAERFRSSIATARAYAGEALLMSPAPDAHTREAHLLLSEIAIRNLDGATARRELALGLANAQPDLPAANELADIGRLDPQPGDLAQLQAWLAGLRAGSLTAAKRMLTDEIEGRLVIESDPAAGIVLLERAIAAARALPHDVEADKARTGAYSVLVFEAAGRGDHARAMALIARELGLLEPGPCSVGMAAEDERTAIVVRDRDGADRGLYNGARRPSDDAPSVPPELARRLDGCAHVRVMATPLLQGQPRVLPPALPWSYVTGMHAAPVGNPPEPHALIVANVTPPDYLQLAVLSPQIVDSLPRTTMLSGPAATPAAVLAEMADASEIQFHTHALTGGGESDASHLVLSPGPDGDYALTAEAIRRRELHGHPVVVLAACHSAQSARYQHVAWSLPDAFLSVGARAVFATATDIPDRSGAAFFARVLERTRASGDPAAALRDERLAADPASWVGDVVLFE
jgi:tetratricopeptide (TPR) repeat protein